MIRSPAPDLPAVHPGPGRRTQARRARNGLAAAVAIAGSLVISTTALALLEHVSDRATEVFGEVDQGLDGYGELFVGDSHRSTDLFAAVDSASSSTESYRLATSESCRQPSEIHATAPTKGDSAPTLSTRGRFCFRPHDVIEYYPLAGNDDRRSVDLAYDVPSAVRSNIADSRLIAASEDEDAYDFRNFPESALRRSKAPSRSNARRREASIMHLVGCARCVGQVGQTLHKPAKLSAFVFPRDFFRSDRSVRQERLPTGVARQRGADRVIAWNFRWVRAARAVLGGQG
jgi:hypothetical protein